MMKYMTPELLIQLQSDDDTIADVAADAWEKAGEVYNQRIEQLRPTLPEDALTILDGPCLHDARVLAVGRNKGTLSFVLQLDRPPNDGVVVMYRLARPPRFVIHNDLGGPRGRFLLYDEFNALEDGSAFVHSILFTGGLEIEIAFNSIAVTRAPLFVPRADGAEQPLDFSAAGAELCEA